ncbi:MAG: universal stress protein [Candidatus Methylomirabilis sp.]
MVGRILFVVDGSVPPREAAALAHGLLPKATEISVLQVVPQLPYAWNAWPAFPNASEDLGRAWAYVSEVGDDLGALGWTVSTRVFFSVLSAAEMDQEVLKLAETVRPDLICLALEGGSVTERIVRGALTPVLVAKPLSHRDDSEGLRERAREYLQPGLVHRMLLLNPAAALVFRHAGIL